MYQPRPVLPVLSRTLRVLTLTPFYPSVEDSSQGAFIADPLRIMGRIGVRNYVIAVQPFYRHPRKAITADSSCNWRQYFSIPGNSGLAFAGDFLAAALTQQVRRLHQQEPFHLIHAHAALPCGDAARLLAKKLRIPFIVSVHGLDAFATRQAGPLWGNWCRRKSAEIYRASKAVICISKKVEEQLAEYPEINSTVIHNGVDPDLFSQGPESSPLTILGVGNLIRIKGHDLLLRAFSNTTASTPDCRLEIIGDGPERERLMRLADELGIAARVSFKGRLGRQAVADAMRRCAVFVLPSSYEGLGCVYLEAMSCRKPAIGCLGQGIDEIIEHGVNGFLVPSGSQEQLTETMLALLGNETLRQRIGNAARATILRRHTLEHQAASLADVYRECAS